MGVGALCSDSYAKKMVIISIIWIKKFNDQSFKLWKLKVGNILVEKYQRVIVDIGTNHNTMSKQNLENIYRKVRSMIQLGLSNSM